MIFPRAYDEIPRRIGAGLDVRPDSTVTGVIRTGEGVVVTTGQVEVAAGQVIVTVPLDMLKAGTIAFEPPLPDPVAGLFSHLGMGVFNKVFLQFPKRFWDEDS